MTTTSGATFTAPSTWWRSEARTRELDAFIEEARARLDVPGASVAVVAAGQIVYEKGFGVRALGTTDPVTPDTVFLMGSITKSMTTMMQATLVDAGSFAWDTPVTRVLPGFELGDPQLTGALVMWHMGCACTGMPRQDLETLFEFGGVSPEQRIASMKTMKPTARMGETYQYSNLMMTAGGYAAAHAFDSGRSLERRKPRIAMGDGERYGLGLVVGSYRDLPVLDHAGGTFGFRTLMSMLPEQGIAVVVLTNTTGAGGDFTDVVHRKVMEAFFDGAEDSARSRLDVHVNARRERIAETLAGLTREPDPRWVRGLAGTYDNPSLGKVQIRAGANGGTLDAGEWQSAIAQKQQADGTVKIVLVDPPLAGGEITVAGDDAHPALSVEYERRTYVFERVARR